MTVYYFDLDGTLVEYDVSFSRIYEESLERLDVEPRQEEAYATNFFDVFGETPEPFAEAMERTSLDVDPQAFSETRRAVEVEHAIPAAGARETVQALSERARVGVLTNGLTTLQRAKLESVGLLDYFDTVVVSQAVDAWKPDPAIYEIAESRLPADEYTFVADDFERDLKPAIEREWNVVLVGDTEPSVQCVERLSDLETDL